jgi:hypothetical protein
MSLSVAIVCASLVYQPSDLDEGQFSRLMKGLHSKFQNVIFVYEGDFQFVGPENLLRDQSRDAFHTSFQGVLACRGDGALLLDVYHRPLDASQPMQRKTVAIVNDTTERQFRPADQKPLPPEVRKGAGYEGLRNGDSPLLIYFSPYFLYSKDLTGLRYELVGWENVGGRRCLCVKLDRIRGMPEGKGPRWTFWIDLERDGHPVKVEEHVGSNLTSRATIELSQVGREDGQTVWFPSRGSDETFRWQQDFLRSPVFRETYTIVLSTIRFDRDLPDSVFSVAGADRVQDVPELQQARTDFAQTPPRPVPKTDRASVQEHLDKTLAKADAQVKQLEASSPARQVWGWTPVLQAALGFVGVLLIGGGLYWKLRH